MLTVITEVFISVFNLKCISFLKTKTDCYNLLQALADFFLLFHNQLLKPCSLKEKNTCIKEKCKRLALPV